MSQRHTISRRALVGLGVGAWVILLAFVSARLQPAGPQWGLTLSEMASDGRVTAAWVAPYFLASNDDIRSGTDIIAIDGIPASQLAGREVPSTVREIAFQDDAGPNVARFSETSGSIWWLLSGGALLFVAVGGVVYRWSSDAALGRVFLALLTSFATALATSPLFRLGYPLAFLLPGLGALVGSSSLLVLFLMFPRRLRGVRLVGVLSYGVGALLIVVAATEPFLSHQGSELADAAAWLWTLVNLVASLVVLGLRLRNRVDRRALSPLLIGAALAVAPLMLLTAVPRLLNAPVSLAPEFAAIGMAAIPISFAYSILRYQVFGLDVFMRRIILRCSTLAIGTALFFTLWQLLRTTGLEPTAAALFGAAACSLVLPTLNRLAAVRLDAWLYQPLSSLSKSPDLGDAQTLEQLASAVTGRLREILPVQWAACLIHDDNTPSDSASRRLLGSDGQLPRWLDPSSTLEQSPTQVSVSPVHRFDTGVVLLISGPRLDGGSLGGIQFEALRLLAHSAAPSFEAGMLRERAADEAGFRQGLLDLARDLAAAATVSDVLRVFSGHAERLLQATTATLTRGSRGEPMQALPELDPDANVLQFQLENGTDEPILCSVSRPSSADRFGKREERRARELAEHTTGALRRAEEREMLEEQLRHRAFYDSLTGLPNRALFLDRIGHAVARGERISQQLAVLFIDLDRFKVVNDSLGHAAGDQLLVQVGQRLRSCLRESDTIARLSGDEFTVLLEGTAAVEDAERAAERILLALRDPFMIDGQETFASASIGIAGGAVARPANRDLLREADIALYRAKAEGRARWVVYDPRMSLGRGEYVHIETDLHRAVERGELRVHYQPIFSLRTSEITGLEALIRWEHPHKGMIPPGQFIPLAEDTGLIVPIGKWVLDEACRQLAEWRSERLADTNVFVSVNLSARQLQHPDLIADVRQTLARTGVDPQRLQLEITESVVMQDPESMVAKLQELKTLGIKLAVDDFGTGYSSLAYLKRFPVDVLKIDRAFVAGVANANQDSAIVKTVVGLARALGLHTTAEGIEERSQWDRLEQLGCDDGQGFIFSRPLRPEAVRELLLGSGLRAAA